MRRKHIIALSGAALLLSLGLGACGQQTEQEAADYSQAILGTWQWSDINNGVKFYSTFMPKGAMTQTFEREDGYIKDRPATWHISGDSLFISDPISADTLRITELTDSTLHLMHVVDSVPLFFSRTEP